jgi:DNA repair protein RadC
MAVPKTINRRPFRRAVWDDQMKLPLAASFAELVNGLVEKVSLRNSDSLADESAIEIMLAPACGRERARDIAHQLIESYGTISEAISKSSIRIKNDTNCNVSEIAIIKAFHLAVIKISEENLEKKDIIGSIDQVEQYLKALLYNKESEEFRVLFLNNRNQLIIDKLMGIGTVNHTPVYPREVLKGAIEYNATSLILVHNHPSGDPTPSPSDVMMTRDIIAAARTVDIVVHDHLIVGKGSVFSMRRDGRSVWPKI